MKLKSINENFKDELLDNTISKYVQARGRGNINRKQATDNPNKTVHPDNADDIEQPDRSGNQTTTSTNDSDVKDMVGASEGDRDRNKPKNLAPNASTSI